MDCEIYTHILFSHSILALQRVHAMAKTASGGPGFNGSLGCDGERGLYLQEHHICMVVGGM